MSITCKAAIIREIGKSTPYSESWPLTIEQVSLEPPRAGEVLVKVAGAGLCNSDLAIISGKRPRPLPLAMGHEGAGEIVEVGTGVRDVRIGDHVVFQFSASCGRCEFCLSGRPSICINARLASNKGELMSGGTRILDANRNVILHHAGVSCFSEYSVLDRGSVVVVDKGVPLSDSALFGCAVMTGAGAVINTAKVATGEKVAVIGLGGVGLNGVMAAKLCGASQIIAIDVDKKKIKLALELGATHGIDANSGTCIEEVLDISGGGVHHAIELSGAMAAMDTAWRILGRGGKLVTAGLTPAGAKFSFQHDDMVSSEKSIVGSYMGSCVPVRDIPMFLALQQSGQMPVERLIDRRIGFDEINSGFDLLASGAALRQILVPHA